MIIKINKRPPKPENSWFTEDLNDYLNDKARANASHTRRQVIRPSEITECVRKTVCLILGLVKEKPVEAKIQRTFDNGNWVHKRYLKSYLPGLGCVATIYVKENGILIPKPFIEIMIEDKDLWVRGAPDAVIINKRDGLPYIFELKSIKQELFRELFQPTDDYIEQVHLYMYMTKIQRTLVFYENRNDADIKDFIIQKDDVKMQLVIDRIRLIQKYVINYPITRELPQKCSSKYCVACIN